MTSQTTAQQPRRTRRAIIALAGAAALALAVGVGLGTWQVHSHSGRAARVQTSGAAAQGEVGAAGTTLVALPSVLTTSAGTPSVYLVGSAAQAQEVQQRVNWAAPAGLSVPAAVLVVGPTDDAALAASLQHLVLADQYPLGPVIDLRTPQ